MATEMSGVDIGLAMALAMKDRVPNKTNTAQRARKLAKMARGGPAGRAREDAEFKRYEEDQALFMARQRLAAQQWEDLQMQERLASIGTERIPPVPAATPQFQGELGGTTAEEEALLAQMQADMANQPGDQGFTSPGYVPGGADALPQATSVSPLPVPQTPQMGVAAPTGTSQSQAGPQGFTSPGYVEGGAAALPQATSVPQEPQVAGPTGTPQAQQPGPQGFTSPGYTQGPQAEAGPVDSTGSAALQWLNELFKKDEQPPQTPQTPQVAGSSAGAQGFESPGYVSGGGQREGESFMEFTQRQHQEKYPQQGQQGMSPEEQQKMQQITQGLESTRPDSTADSTISWPTMGDQGAQTPGGFESGGYNPDVARREGESFMEYTQRMHEQRYPSGGGNPDEIVGALLKQYGSQLEAAGYGEQLKKFASGNYNKADIDALIGQYGSALPKKIREQLQKVSEMLASQEGAAVGADAANVVVEELPGLDPNYAGQQGTTSSGSSQFTTQHGFGAKDYNPDVAILPDETFMEYTQRMHQRNKKMNREQQFEELIEEGTQRWRDKVSPPA